MILESDVSDSFSGTQEATGQRIRHEAVDFLRPTESLYQLCHMPTSKRQALILTGDQKLEQSLVPALDRNGYDAVATADIETALGRVRPNHPDLILLDVDMTEVECLDVVRRLGQFAGASGILLLVSEASMYQVAAAMGLGARIYLKKPVGVEDLRLAVDQIDHQKKLAMEIRELRAAREGGDRIPRIHGSSPEMQRILKLVGQVASTSVNVMIVGEPGTGKRLISEAIHHNSPRRGQRFLHLSCAGLSENLIEAELFGHEDGAFGGAGPRQAGRLERCDGGTLLIDEIGETTRKTQEKLLRFLTDGTYQPLGRHGSPGTADVRIIGASIRNLETDVREDRFNKELFHRLHGVQISVPPLRERKTDIPVLVDRFIRVYARISDKPVRTLTPEALARLMGHDWPGNVRELETTIEHAIPMSGGSSLGIDDLPAFPERVEGGVTGPRIPGSTIQEIEREAILRTLEQVGGSTTRAARTLNMSVRKIQYKLKEYRLTTASTLRVETVPVTPVERPVPAKSAVFVAGGESSD